MESKFKFCRRLQIPLQRTLETSKEVLLKAYKLQFLFTSKKYGGTLEN